MRYAPVTLAKNQSMSSSFTSTGVDINQTVAFSVQASWTGSPVGTLSIQVSNDDVPVAASPNNPVGADPAANVVNWSTYTGSSRSTVPDGNFLWNFPDAGYRWVRLAYSANSGSGTCSVQYSGKGV